MTLYLNDKEWKGKHIMERKKLYEQLEIGLAPYGAFSFSHFHVLNISDTGALVATYEPDTFAKDELLHICIDPRSSYLSRPINCIAQIACVAEPSSKGIVKYIEQRGEDSNINSIVGIKFFIHVEADQNDLVSFVDINSQNYA